VTALLAVLASAAVGMVLVWLALEVMDRWP